ncbi:MAG: SelB C-terminal domain-containing protein, partial [Deltaproteobacteria bacterium]|nr:SelB C-terminal domain-containing protein [Nannocystaceae bacterium]
AGLERKARIVSEGDRVRRAAQPAHGPTLSPLETQLLAQFAAWGMEPARPKEVAAATAATLKLGDAQIKPMLDRLLAARRLVKVKPDLYVHADVIDQLRTRLVAFLEAHKTIDAQQWKELTGASRKYTIPLAEFFDGEKLTLRVGDLRRKR